MYYNRWWGWECMLENECFTHSKKCFSPTCVVFDSYDEATDYIDRWQWGYVGELQRKRNAQRVKYHDYTP